MTRDATTEEHAGTNAGAPATAEEQGIADVNQASTNVSGVPALKDITSITRERRGIWARLENGHRLFYPQHVLKCPLCPVTDQVWWRSFCSVGKRSTGSTWESLPYINLGDRHGRFNVRKEFRLHLGSRHRGYLGVKQPPHIRHAGIYEDKYGRDDGIW